MNILFIFLQNKFGFVTELFISMANSYFNDSAIYREIYDWFKVIERHYRQNGKSKKEARWLAYDSVEQRFNIKYSRARVIVKSEEKNKVRLTNKEKTAIYFNNMELINLINIVNEDYKEHR